LSIENKRLIAGFPNQFLWLALVDDGVTKVFEHRGVDRWEENL
jgi:hypothetical protein